MNFCFKFRIPLSFAYALLMTALLFFWRGFLPHANPLPASTAPMTLQLLASASEPKPAAVERPVEPARLVPAKTPPTPVRRESVAMPGVPAVSAVVPTPSHTTTVDVPSTLPALTSTSRADEEAAYIAAVRAHLQKIKRYPSGREASQERPSGVAHVRFVLRRDGSLIEAGIETSSGSMLLDNAALATVRRGNYPMFPEPVWVGKAQQIFSVILEFVPSK